MAEQKPYASTRRGKDVCDRVFTSGGERVTELSRNAEGQGTVGCDGETTRPYLHHRQKQLDRDVVQYRAEERADHRDNEKRDA